jgi:hypothetical protein
MTCSELLPLSDCFKEGCVLRDGFPGMLYHDVPEAEAKIWFGK